MFSYLAHLLRTLRHHPAYSALNVLGLALALACSLLLYWLVRRQAATQVASLFYLTPAVTALMAWVLFGERLDMLSIVGMVACAVAVLLVNVRQARGRVTPP